MEAGYNTVLRSSEMYEHYEKFTDAMYLLTTAFVADYRDILRRLSVLIQRSGVHVVKINQETAAVQAELLALLQVPGPMEADVRRRYNSDRELWQGVPLSGWDDAQDRLTQLKQTLLVTLCEKLGERVPCVGPINKARMTMFDFSSIPIGIDPASVAARAVYGNDDVITWATHFYSFWNDGRSADEVATALLTEW